MITIVKTISREFGDSELEIEAEYDDSICIICRKMNVSRVFGGERSTGGKIEIYGNFSLTEHNGFLQMDEISRQDAEDALAVFKAIFGESENQEDNG
jgi:hypothetical protein